MASRFDGALTAYRIVRAGSPPFDGTGACRWGGRWTSPGRFVIHAAESYALAVLESLVHFNIGELPPNLVVVQLAVPGDVSREVLPAEEIPNWERSDSLSRAREIGDRWYDERRSAVLVVPSVLSPFECNLLIHQDHPHTRQIEVGEPRPARLDERLQSLIRGGSNQNA